MIKLGSWIVFLGMVMIGLWAVSRMSVEPKQQEREEDAYEKERDSFSLKEGERETD